MAPHICCFYVFENVDADGSLRRSSAILDINI